MAGKKTRFKYTIRINKEEFVLFTAIVCFFELFSLSRLEELGIFAPFPSVILAGLAMGRLAFSLYEILVWTKSGGKGYSYLAGWVLLFVLSLLISPLLRFSIRVNYIIAIITYIGFALFTDRMLRERNQSYCYCLYYYFGIVSFLDLLSVLLLPNGLNPNYDLTFAGGKNAAFDYNSIFLLLLYLKNNNDSKKAAIWTIPFIVGGIIRKSNNTTICLSILFILFILNCRKRNSIKYDNMWIKTVIPSVIVIWIGLVFFSSSSIIVGIVTKLTGSVKAINFSGRTILWKQAIDRFMMYPFGGAPEGLKYTIRATKILEYSHPHNKYLSILGGDGIISFTVFFVVLLITTRRKGKAGSHITKIGASVLFAFLLHMIMDDSSYFRIFLLLFLVYYEERCFIRHPTN